MQHTRLCIHSICHKKTLLMTSGALRFVMYTYRNNLLGGMVIDIQGHPRHNAFVTACGHLANI